MSLRNKPPPVIEAKTQCDSANDLNLKSFFNMNLFCILISKPKSYLKLIDKYIFSEGEQLPFTLFR